MNMLDWLDLLEDPFDSVSTLSGAEKKQIADLLKSMTLRHKAKLSGAAGARSNATEWPSSHQKLVHKFIFTRGFSGVFIGSQFLTQKQKQFLTKE